MIRVLNLPNPDSGTEGWKISIDKNAEYPYRLKLAGSDRCKSHIGMSIVTEDYESLTTPSGIDTFAASKLISISKVVDGVNTYIPLLKSALSEDDTDISFIHFETEFGCVISDVRLHNCKAISHFIDSNDLYMSITMAIITVDHNEPAIVSIHHGYKGGKNLSIQEISVFHNPLRHMVSGSVMGGSSLEMNSSTIKVDSIENNVISLPKFDLASVAIDE